MKKMDSVERGMNSVATTIIIPRKEYWSNHGSSWRPPVLKFCTLSTELYGLDNDALNAIFVEDGSNIITELNGFVK